MSSLKSPNADPHIVPPAEAWTMIDEGAMVLDVRTPYEFENGHLPNAINIPYNQLDKRIGEISHARSKPIVLYCEVGARSGIAQQILVSNGFTHAYNIGGYSDLLHLR